MFCWVERSRARITVACTHRAPLRHNRAVPIRSRLAWPLCLSLAVAAGLLVYGAGLGWFANRLADDLTATIQPIPALEDQQHRSD